jgi:hypothetical protein
MKVMLKVNAPATPTIYVATILLIFMELFISQNHTTHGASENSDEQIILQDPTIWRLAISGLRIEGLKQQLPEDCESIGDGTMEGS